MRVRFERSGGFAGITLAHDFDSTELPHEQTVELTRLVSEARFFELPAVIASAKSGADLFQYSISVEDGAQKHSVQFVQGEAPEHLRPLVQWLTQAQKNLIASQKRPDQNA
jgi:hypothetical protein